jgi:serine/threonine-protein kinase
VHRDVSPQNIHVGTDGVPRVLDFGIAKAHERSQNTRTGELKGKIAYMAPEQLLDAHADRRTDVRAAAVVLWEALAGRPLFHGENEGRTVTRILNQSVPAPSTFAPHVSPALDQVVLKALSSNPADRYATALEMAHALDQVGMAGPDEIARWVLTHGAEVLREQSLVQATLELRTVGEALRISAPPPPPSSHRRARTSGSSRPSTVERLARRAARHRGGQSNRRPSPSSSPPPASTRRQALKRPTWRMTYFHAGMMAFLAFVFAFGASAAWLLKMR